MRISCLVPIHRFADFSEAEEVEPYGWWTAQCPRTRRYLVLFEQALPFSGLFAATLMLLEFNVWVSFKLSFKLPYYNISIYGIFATSYLEHSIRKFPMEKQRTNTKSKTACLLFPISVNPFRWNEFRCNEFRCTEPGYKLSYKQFYNPAERVCMENYNPLAKVCGQMV